MNNLPESDWNKIGRHQSVFINRYCERVLKEIRILCDDQSISDHERYLSIYKLIHNRDKVIASIFDRWSRSQLPYIIIKLINEKLINDDELSKLSDEAREKIKIMKSLYDC